MPKQESKFMIVWRVAYPILIFFGAEFVAEFIFGMFVLGDLISENPMVMSNPNQFMDAFTNGLYGYATLMMIVRNGLMIPIFLLLMHLDRRKDRLLGRYQAYQLPHWAWFLLLPVVGFTAAIGFNQVMSLTQLEKIDKLYQDASQMIFDENVPMWLTIVATSVMAPIVEELLFRGLIYKRMRNHVSPLFSSLISATMFGLIHGNLVQFIYAFLVGMIICWVYETFKSIWAPIIFHAGANLIAVLISEFLPGFGGDLSIGLFMLLTVGWLAATFLILWLFYKKIHCAPVNAQETGDHS